jgi:hypothetical protein
MLRQTASEYERSTQLIGLVWYQACSINEISKGSVSHNTDGRHSSPGTTPHLESMKAKGRHSSPGASPHLESRHSTPGASMKATVLEILGQHKARNKSQNTQPLSHVGRKKTP